MSRVVVRQITSGHAVFNAEVEKEIECRSHHDEPVRFYCDDCDACVCVLCTFHAHRGHRVTSFHDAAARQRALVLGLLERCRRRIDDVDQLAAALGGCDKLVGDTAQQIHDTASAFVQVSSTRAAASTRVLEYYSSSFEYFLLLEFSLISISGCKFPFPVTLFAVS